MSQLFNKKLDKTIFFPEDENGREISICRCNVVAICGDAGSGKSTLADMLKKRFSNSSTLECDRYHKWERNDENWNKFTHLNPDANYIARMNSDIFDLKIGKSVYCVGYNQRNILIYLFLNQRYHCSFLLYSLHQGLNE